MSQLKQTVNAIVRTGRIMAACLVLLVAGSTSSRAAGTPRGTVIINQATAAFTFSDSARSVNSNIIAVTIEQLAAVNWIPPTGSRAATLNAPVDYPASITNSGNWEDEFDITAGSSGGFVTAVYLDPDGDGVLSPPEISAGPLARTPLIMADSSVHVVVRVLIPNNPALIGQIDVVTASAVSAYDPAKSASGVYTTSISSALLQAAKSVSNPVPYPGDRVTYTIQYTNTGSADASGVTVSDILDNNLVFVPGSAAPAPSSVTGQTIAWDLGTIPPGSGTIRFDVDIVNTVPPGTEIHNLADFRYYDGPNPLQIGSTESDFITVQDPRVTVNFVADRTGSGEPGDTVDYPYTITNNGPAPEAFDIGFTSSLPLPWLVYHDADGNGRIDAGESATTGTGQLPAGAAYRIVARTVLPRVPVDRTVDSTVFRVSSTTNPDNFRTRRGTTTIIIPVMSLQKFADAPDPRPGNEIRYVLTYTNSGAGQAYGFVVADSIPGNTAYVPESVRLNFVGKTDAADGDEVTVSGGEILVRVGTVGGASSGIIEFRVRIVL